MTTETFMVYPPEVKALMALLNEEIARYRTGTAKQCEQLPPAIARKITDQLEYDLAPLYGELMKLELLGTPAMLVTLPSLFAKDVR
jgi:hypothetical protein